MKKSISVRLLTALGGLALLAFCAAVVAEGFFHVPVTAVAGELLSSGSWPAVLCKILCALALLTLAVAVVICALPGRKPKQTGSIMQKGVDGPIGITIGAIEKMVLACAAKHPEITNTEVDVTEVRDGVVILMNVQQVGGVSIPLSVARLQKQVRAYVNGRTGLDVAEVRVMVDNETDDHVASEFEVEDTVMPGAALRAEAPVQEAAVPEEPLSEQLRQIAEITQQTAAEEISEAEEEPAAELPVVVSTPEELDALLPVPEVAPDIFEDDEEKPLHQRVFGAEEMPLTVPMPPEMAQEAPMPPEAPGPVQDDMPAAEIPAELPDETPEEDWTAPSMQAAAEEVLTGDAPQDAEAQEQTEIPAEEEELPVM